MKIIIAPQAFKECASAQVIAESIAKGARRALPEAQFILAPVADGGDGTLNVLVDAKQGEYKSCTALNACQEPQEVLWGVLPGPKPIAIIELARICGLAALPLEKRHPSITTTYGVGQVIRHALDLGYRNFFIGLGGSATNDAGTGLASALGARFLDAKGEELPAGGAALAALEQIDLSGLDLRLQECKIVAGCDVNNPLIGLQGCTQVYASQKGAASLEIKQLENSLKKFATVVNHQLNKHIEAIPYGGSAGGAASSLSLFAHAELVSGIEWVLTELAFEQLLEEASLVIVAEGKLDGQTSYQKAPIGVAQWAKQKHVPVLALAGTLGAKSSLVHQFGIDAYIPVSFLTLKTPPENALNLLEQAAEEAIRCFSIGRK